MENTPDKIGKYKLIREVGRGATATVYLAEHPQYPDPVALKLVRFDDKAKDEAKWNRRLMKLLRAERDVSRRLDHPNIIKIFDTTVEKDYAYHRDGVLSGHDLGAVLQLPESAAASSHDRHDLQVCDGPGLRLPAGHRAP
jgi:serine/threonine protein kinase